VFLKAVQVARALDPPNDWDRWLTRVAINACRDRRRAGWWRRFRWSTDPIDRLELPAETRDPDRLAIDAQLRDRLWRAFRVLPGRQQEVFVLRQVEQWSTDEVAEALQITTGSVKRHLFRAIRHLRLSLGGDR
jgi:RNA polymerase sigma-70 factor (ECF subfamily)